MYLIALCDDEIKELEKAREMLLCYGKTRTGSRFTIDCFEAAEGLLERVKKEDYAPDLILMDIYMPSRPGIEVVRELRDMGNQSRIIFLTFSKEHALEAFRVDAVQYLVKPVSEEELFPVLDRVFDTVESERRKYILLRIDGRLQRVELSDIIYCEAQGKMQCLHLAGGGFYLLRITMTELFGMLSCYQEFVRVGVAYIVNLVHVESLSRQEVEMDNGKKIYPPRGAYQPLREKYFAYYCGEDGV